jgi:hypothetical protein
MSTRTRPRTHQQSTASTRRFARSGAAPKSRRTTAGRSSGLTMPKRHRPPKSNKDKALETITGMVGGKKAASAGGKGAKAGAGVAMLTAAAGLAFKNREKLTSMLKRGGGKPDTDTSLPPAGTTGAEVHGPTRANATNLSSGASGTATATGTSAGAADARSATPSSIDAPDTTLGGTAGMGTSDPLADTTLGGTAGTGSSDALADPEQTESPWVSPDDPRTEEPPGADR